MLEGTATQMSKTSKINLIDLAGSERASTALNDDVIDSKQTYDLRLKVYKQTLIQSVSVETS